MHVLGPRGKRLIDDLLARGGAVTRERRGGVVAAPSLPTQSTRAQWTVWIANGRVLCRGGSRHVIGGSADYVTQHDVGAVPTANSVVLLRYTQPTVDASGSIVAGSWRDSAAVMLSGTPSDYGDTETERRVILAAIAIVGDAPQVTQYWEGPVWVVPLVDRAALYET